MPDEDQESSGDGKNGWTCLEEQVVNVIIRRRSRKTCCGPCSERRCCNSCFQRKWLNNNYWRIGFLAGVCLLLCLAFLIWLVVPFMKTLSYKSAHCSTTSINNNGRQSCMCGKGCRSTYPCIRVNVNYYTNDRSDSGYGMLYDVEFGGSCSFSPPCRWNTDANANAVSAFESQMKGKRDYPCFVDTSGNSEYIMLGPRLNMAAAVNLILWPGLGFIALFATMIIMYKTCSFRAYVYKSKAPSDIKTSADAILETGKTSLKDYPLEERERIVLDTHPDRDESLL